MAGFRILALWLGLMLLPLAASPARGCSMTLAAQAGAPAHGHDCCDGLSRCDPACCALPARSAAPADRPIFPPAAVPVVAHDELASHVQPVDPPPPRSAHA